MSTSVDTLAHLKAIFNQIFFIEMQDFKGGLFSCYRVLASCTIYLCIGVATALETLCECAGWPDFCFVLFVCFTSQVNSYGHCGTVSSPNHTFFLGKLEQAVNQ